MSKLTQKQDKFAMAYVETGNASEAYRRCYNVGEKTKDETVWVKACELLKNGKVAARVVELQAGHQRRHEVTVDSLTAEYEEAREIARNLDQPAPMVSATAGKAKLHGFGGDKWAVTGANDGPIDHKGTVWFVNATPKS